MPSDQVTSPSTADGGRILASLIAAAKALRLYPRTNPTVDLTLRRLEDDLRATVTTAPLVLGVAKNGFILNGERVRTIQEEIGRLAFKLHCLNIVEIIFDPGLLRSELSEVLGVLNIRYEGLRDLGPFDNTLRSRGIEKVRVRYAELVQPGEGDGEGEVAIEPVLANAGQLLAMLSDPSKFAQEMVRLCVGVPQVAGEERIDAQISFVDRFLQSMVTAIESAPAVERPDYYDRLSASLDALVKSADVSGTRHGDLPRVDLSHVDSRLFEVLPQRDLVKEVSSKVKLHQGATTVMASALQDLPLSASGAKKRPSVLNVIEEGREPAASLHGNLRIIEEIVVGGDVDGEYPGIKYAERDKNKNFSLDGFSFPSVLTAEERRQTEQMVDLDEWRPEVDSVETILDMLRNEKAPNFVEMITDRLTEKLTEFLSRGEIEPALYVLRGLNLERRERRGDPTNLALLEASLHHVESVDNVSLLLRFAETLPVESAAFESIQSFLFFLDKRVIHTIIGVVATDRGRYSGRRVLALAQFLCRNRLDLLAEGLNGEEPEVVKTVVWLLGRFGVPAVRHLERVTTHPKPRVRREAVHSLSRIDAAASTRLLAGMIGDPDDRVATSALRAIISRQSSEAAPGIESALLATKLDGRPTIGLLLIKAAGRVGTAPTLAALHRVEERAGLRWKLKQSSLRKALESAVKEIEARLERDNSSTGAK